MPLAFTQEDCVVTNCFSLFLSQKRNQANDKECIPAIIVRLYFFEVEIYRKKIILIMAQT